MKSCVAAGGGLRCAVGCSSETVFEGFGIYGASASEIPPDRRDGADEVGQPGLHHHGEIGKLCGPFVDVQPMEIVPHDVLRRIPLGIAILSG